MNTLNNAKERIWFWDSIKFIMILFVVIGHFFENSNSFGGIDVMPIRLFIYSFHMPMFLFIFGLFFKEKNIARKIIFYIVSGYLLKALIYFSELIITGKARFTLFYDMGVPWFMFVLAWYTLLAWILRKADKRIVLAVSFAIPLYTGYLKEIGDCLCFSRMFVFFPIFWLGTMIDPNDLITKIKKYRKYLLIPSACLIIGWFLICELKYQNVKILMHLFTGRNPFSAQTNGLGFLYRILAYAVSALIGAAILIVVPQKKIPVVSYLGRNTVNVYFWHYSFLFLI